MAAGYPASCGLDAHPDIQALVAERRLLPVEAA
jgi:hypothetical protein